MSTVNAEMKTGLSKKSKMYYLHSAIGVAIMFLFGFLPPFSTVTPLGMKFLGIFIGLIYLWSLVDMGWPIFAAFVAMITLGCMPITQIYTSAFANQTVMLCLFPMLVIMPLAETGIFDYVAAWVLKQKFLQGHPWRLTIGLFLLVYIGCICHGGFALLFMVFELTYKICDMCGMKRSHPWAGAIITGVVVSHMLGGAIFPFTGLPLFFLGVFGAVQPFTWPFLQYMIYMLVMWAVIFVFYCIFIFLLRVDMTELKEADPSKFVKELPPVSSYQKKAASLMAIFIFTLIFVGIASAFKSDNIIVTLCKNIGLVGVSWIFICIMIVWRINDKAAFTLGFMSSKVLWDSILIICIGMSFGPAIAGEKTGIGTWLYQLTAPILAGHSAFSFIMLVCIITLIMTNFMNNTVVIMLMFSVIASYIEPMGLNIVTVAALMIIASQMAFLLPGASFYAGLSHGQAMHVGRKNGFYWGAVMMVSAGLSMPIMYFVGNALF